MTNFDSGDSRCVLNYKIIMDSPSLSLTPHTFSRSSATLDSASMRTAKGAGPITARQTFRSDTRVNACENMNPDILVQFEVGLTKTT